jgi:hypothetical protein
MDWRSESSGGNPEGGRSAPDPLASRTLAALYASQGHTDVAEAIRATLDPRPGDEAPAVPGQSSPGQAQSGLTYLQRLVSLREATRRVREAGTGVGPTVGSHGR